MATASANPVKANPRHVPRRGIMLTGRIWTWKTITITSPLIEVILVLKAVMSKIPVISQRRRRAGITAAAGGSRAVTKAGTTLRTVPKNRATAEVITSPLAAAAATREATVEKGRPMAVSTVPAIRITKVAVTAHPVIAVKITGAVITSVPPLMARAICLMDLMMITPAVPADPPEVTKIVIIPNALPLSVITIRTMIITAVIRRAAPMVMGMTMIIKVRTRIVIEWKGVPMKAHQDGPTVTN